MKIKLVLKKSASSLLFRESLKNFREKIKVICTKIIIKADIVFVKVIYIAKNTHVFDITNTRGTSNDIL